jgi:hypothetical protein
MGGSACSRPTPSPAPGSDGRVPLPGTTGHRTPVRDRPGTAPIDGPVPDGPSAPPPPTSPGRSASARTGRPRTGGCSPSARLGAARSTDRTATAPSWRPPGSHCAPGGPVSAWAPKATWARRSPRRAGSPGGRERRSRPATDDVAQASPTPRASLTSTSPGPSVPFPRLESPPTSDAPACARRPRAGRRCHRGSPAQGRCRRACAPTQRSGRRTSPGSSRERTPRRAWRSRGSVPRPVTARTRGAVPARPPLVSPWPGSA